MPAKIFIIFNSYKIFICNQTSRCGDVMLAIDHFFCQNTKFHFLLCLKQDSLIVKEWVFPSSILAFLMYETRKFLGKCTSGREPCQKIATDKKRGRILEAVDCFGQHVVHFCAEVISWISVYL